MSSRRKKSGSLRDFSTHPNSSVDNTLPLFPLTVEESDLPDGGFAAWCTVFAAFLSQFCGYGYTSAFGVYQAFYSEQYLQNESPSAVSWIGSLTTFLLTSMGPVCGPLFDNGYFHHVYITGAILQSLSIFMLSLVQPGQYYQILLAQGVMSGIGQGLIYVPSFAILSHHFKRRRATTMSIATSGVALGGIVHTIMLNTLLNGSVGFKMGVRISATFVTVLLFLSCVLMRTRYGAMRQGATSFNFWKATQKCFMEIPSLFTIIGFTLFQVAYLYPFFYFQVDALRHGLSDSFSFYSLVIVNAGSFFGRVGAGFLLPFTGVINLTIISAVVCVVLIVCMIWLGSAASVVVIGVLYGFFSGINIAMMAPMLGLTSDPAELGVRMGVGFAITGIGDLVGPPICGALLTAHYLWWVPAVFCGAIALVSSGLFVGVRIAILRARSGSSGRSTSVEGKEVTRNGGEERNVIEVSGLQSHEEEKTRLDVGMLSSLSR